jgi:UDP-glucose:tetrahydrobiopterin glucosyltransferase
MHILFLSTSVGPLGSGIGGGVELTLRNLANGLAALGHSVTVVAPTGSVVGVRKSVASMVGLVEVDGELHVPSQTLDRSTPLNVPRNSVLNNMWQRVVELSRAGDVDVVLNFSYDALPFVQASECAIPVAHLVSMGSLSDEMDSAVDAAFANQPHGVAMHSHAQARTFGSGIAQRVMIVGSGIDVDAYEFSPTSGDDIAFVGRISREKGINDVFAVSALSGRRVRAFGVMEDRAVWDAAVTAFPDARVEYRGFLPTSDLQRELGTCAALIMVHQWVEAFGNVAIEAMACGVPVITYDRGGPAEIVRDGMTGFVVPPDDVHAVVNALSRIGSIRRDRCRAMVLEQYSERAFAGRVAAWLGSMERP